MTSIGNLFKEQILHYGTEENHVKQLIAKCQQVAELEVQFARIHMELEALTERRRHLVQQIRRLRLNPRRQPGETRAIFDQLKANVSSLETLSRIQRKLEREFYSHCNELLRAMRTLETKHFA